MYGITFHYEAFYNYLITFRVILNLFYAHFNALKIHHMAFSIYVMAI
jgi:hypothetical protein